MPCLHVRDVGCVGKRYSQTPPTTAIPGWQERRSTNRAERKPLYALMRGCRSMRGRTTGWYVRTLPWVAVASHQQLIICSVATPSPLSPTRTLTTSPDRIYMLPKSCAALCLAPPQSCGTSGPAQTCHNIQAMPCRPGASAIAMWSCFAERML